MLILIGIQPATLCAQVVIDEDLTLALKEAPPDSQVAAFILFKQQGGYDKFSPLTRGKSKANVRRLVVSQLKQIAEKSYKEFMVSFGNDVIVDRRFWVVNGLSVKATAKTYERIFKNSDILRIYHRWVKPDGIIFHDGKKTRLPIVKSNKNHKKTEFKLGHDVRIPWNLRIMNADKAWLALGYTGNGVIIGLVDSGTNIYHPDLANNLWINEDEIPNNGIDDDGNGYVDDYYGYNFANENQNIRDDFFHGTEAASTIHGDGTGGIITGVAPRADIMVIRMYDQTSTYNNFHLWRAFQYDTWEGFEYLIENGADVVNMSFDWKPSEKPLIVPWRYVCENVATTGVVLVAGAGNSRSFFSTPYQITPPANSPFVISVGGTDDKDVIDRMSSRGNVTWQDEAPFFDAPYPPGMAKPDVCSPIGRFPLINWSSTGYVLESGHAGTSLSGPQVSGAVALLLEKNPELMPLEVKEIFMKSAEDLGAPGWDSYYGAGRVDCFRALTYDVFPDIRLKGRFLKKNKNETDPKLLINSKKNIICIELENRNSIAARHVALHLTTGCEGVDISEPQSLLDEIETDTPITLQYTVSLDNSVRKGQEIRFSLCVHPVNGKKSFIPISFQSEGGDILIIDDDTDGMFEKTLAEIVTKLGYTYNIHTNRSYGTPSKETLDAYDLVLWTTGEDNVNTITLDDWKTIKAYIQDGGNVLLSGQFIGNEKDARGCIEEYFNVTYNSVDKYSSNFKELTISVPGKPEFTVKKNMFYRYHDSYTYDDSDQSVITMSKTEKISGGLLKQNNGKIVHMTFLPEDIPVLDERLSLFRSVINYLNK